MIFSWQLSLDIGSTPYSCPVIKIILAACIDGLQKMRLTSMHAALPAHIGCRSSIKFRHQSKICRTVFAVRGRTDICTNLPCRRREGRPVGQSCLVLWDRRHCELPWIIKDPIAVVHICFAIKAIGGTRSCVPTWFLPMFDSVSFLGQPLPVLILARWPFPLHP